ncbi:Zinc/iron permease [Chytriomyces sp. MP71]|nr:Zinc/iron permease [Chytriomyces sp. MP71]
MPSIASRALPFAAAVFLILTLAGQPAVAHAAGESSSSVSDNSTAMADACAAELIGSYNQGFHIGGLFIVLAASGLGIFGTFLLGKVQSLTLANILQLCKMFGIGVIAGTAWIHLLPDAFSQFGSPCLDARFQSYGPSFVGVFGLMAAFTVQLIEMGIMGSTPSADKSTPVASPVKLDHESHASHDHHVHHETGLHTTDVAGRDVCETDPHSHGRSEKETAVMLLEAGILFHSLIIGITLGVTADDGFKTLLVAVCFHQLFEGMALGVLIGNLQLRDWTKTLLCLLYPLTTPIGIAIGIGVHDSYNANSGTLVLTQGIFNSLSAGILFYNTYTELMSEEISHNHSFRKFQPIFKAACFLALYCGAAAMAVVAVWA